MEINARTNFLGVAINTETGTSNPQVQKALDQGLQLLDIMEFIKVTTINSFNPFGG